MLRQLRNYLGLVCRIWMAPGNRGRRMTRLLRSVAWLINKKTLQRPWTLAVYRDLNLRLRCYPTSIIALHVVQRSEWHDWDTARFITELLRAGDTFMDVGANIGLYTLPAARIVGKSGTVIAVEPSPVNRARLEENLALNDIATAQVVPCALGEEAGELRFHDDDALAHLDPAAASSPSAADGLRVPVQTLDSLMPAGDAEVVLLKVDVEGFELPVFRGAAATMRAGRLPVILFEMNHSHDRYSIGSGEVFGFLQDAGYEVARYEHDTRRLVRDALEGDLVAYTPRGLELMRQRVLQAE